MSKQEELEKREEEEVLEGKEEGKEEAVSELSEEEREEQERIEQEFEQAQERLGGLIGLVDERYEAPDSSLAKNPEQLEQYKLHNDDILKLCVERGLQKGLSPEQLRTLETAAVLHDLTKGDQPPEEMADIPNYVLAAHGEMAAGEVEDILEGHPEILTGILGEEYSQEQAEETIALIQQAIKSHMGPNPGFMANVLKGVNEKLAEKRLDEKELLLVEHPYPEKGEPIAETLLAADMRSLAGRKGREKVLATHEASPFFRNQDVKVCGEYRKMGIDLGFGEAALLSGFTSAQEAVEMMHNEDDREWVGEAFEASKQGEYVFEGETVVYSQAMAKKQEFEKAKELAKAREGLEEAEIE